SLIVSTAIVFSLMLALPPTATLFPYATLFRSPLLRHRPVGAGRRGGRRDRLRRLPGARLRGRRAGRALPRRAGLLRRRRGRARRSEEHTSELQSRENIVCRLLLEKKN